MYIYLIMRVARLGFRLHLLLDPASHLLLSHQLHVLVLVFLRHLPTAHDQIYVCTYINTHTDTHRHTQFRILGVGFRIW